MSWYGWFRGGDQRRSRLSAGAGADARAGAAAREGAAARGEDGVRTGADRLTCPRVLNARVWVPRLYPPKRLLDGAGPAGRGTAMARPR